MTFSIGPYQLENPFILAPMAGVTDRPFRQLCRKMGAGLVVSEMVSSKPQCRSSKKTQLRMNHEGEPSPRAVQIAGGDAALMADAARFNVDNGAEIIDINMGCPAKKVCNKAAGSALLRDEALVAEILQAVVSAVDVPVTLKIRTGWDKQSNNAQTIGKIAESEGIQLLTIHGRSRACHFKGEAEHATVAAVKSNINIPVVVNGDINDPQTAMHLLAQTKADAVMIGRAAQGKPWIFSELNHYLTTGEVSPQKNNAEILEILLQHLTALYEFYGEYMGLRIARKHVAWYCQDKSNAVSFRHSFNQLESGEAQLSALTSYLN